MLLALLLIGPVPLPIAAPGEVRGETIHATYEVDLLGRAFAEFALPKGPKAIVAGSWEPAPRSSGAWRSSRVRVALDGGEERSAPLGRLAGPPDEGGRRLLQLGPLPYREGGRLVIEAKGPVRGTLRLTIAPGRPAATQP